MNEKLSVLFKKRSVRILLAAAVLFAVFICQFVLNHYTKLFTDDYSYAFSWASGERLTALSQIPDSIAAHSKLMNGRTLDHLLLQLSMLVSERAFDLINSGIFILFVLLSVMNGTASRKSIDPVKLLLFFFGIWFLIPAYGSAFLWKTGSCNYLWSLVIVLFATLPASLEMGNPQEDSVPKTIVKSLLLFVLGTLAGATNENTAAALIVMLALSFVFIRIKTGKFKFWIVSELIGSVVGLLSMLLAPGQSKRLDNAGGLASLGGMIKNCVFLTNRLFSSLIVLFMITVAVLCYEMIGNRSKTKEEKRQAVISLFPFFVWFIGGLAGIYSLIILDSVPDRALTAPFAFIIIAVFALLKTLDINQTDVFKKVSCAVVAVVIVGFGLSAINATLDLKQTYVAYNQREQVIQELKEKGETELMIKPVYGYTIYNKASSDGDISFDSESWVNRHMAEYYEVEAIHRLRN